MDKKEKLLAEMEDFLHFHTSELDEEEKSWALEKGYRKCSQWCIFRHRPEDFFVKCRHNESESHAYLSSVIYQTIKHEMDEEAELLATRNADVIFKISGKKWAIEVETGTVYKKSKQKLQKKVNRLNKTYPNRWFFVITHRDLRKKYRQFGKVVERKQIISKLGEFS